MVAMLKRQGDKLVLELDPAVLRASGIDPDAPVDISADTGRVVISSASGQGVPADTVDAAVEEMDRRYGRMMKRLAE